MLNFFVKRPIAVSMLYSAIVLLGIISLSKLKVSLFPNIVFPRLTVLTPYGNIAPEEIENLVTRPIEDALSSVNGVTRITSRSQEGVSLVDVSLEWGQSMDQAVINIRQKLDLTRTVLPQDTGKSIIARFDPSADPVITLVARPRNLTFERTRDYIEKNVRPFLERIDGVSSLSISGGRKREIQVRVDARRMYAYGLSIDSISRALGAANFNFPAGAVKKGDKEFSVRVEGQFQNLEEIRNTIVSINEGGAPVYLHQVALVADSYREQKGATYYNGEPAIIVGLKKEPGKNTIETAANIRSEIAQINKRFEKSLHFDIVNDSSLYIQNSISSVRNAALLGGLIAFLVLLAFLKDIRASLIVALAIPVSILATFVLMFTRGISLNIMSLGGLAMGVGMLVDNAIVVLESIFNEQESYPDRSAREGAIEGTRKVAGSVIASTLTSVVVFVPIIFVPGIAGEVFRDLALTVSFSLLSSLFCALSLIPMLAGLTPAPGSRLSRFCDNVNTLATPAFLIADRFVETLKERYCHALSFALKKPGLTLGVAGAMALMGISLFAFVPRSLFPEVDLGSVHGVMKVAGGTGIQDAEKLHLQIHEYLKKNKMTVHAISSVGYDEDDITSRLKGVKKPDYSESQFYLNTKNFSSHHFIQELDQGLSRTVSSERNFRVKGDALQELLGANSRYLILEIESRERSTARQGALWIQNQLKDHPRIKSLSSSAEARDPEIQIRLDRQKIGAQGLSSEAVAGVIRTAVHGSVASIYREKDREIPILVRLREEDRRRMDQLQNLYIQSKEGGAPIGAYLKPVSVLGYGDILRRNQRRIEILKVEYHPGYRAEVEALLNQLGKKSGAHIDLPPDSGYFTRVYLENAETLDSLGDLFFAFLLSTVLIYQLLAGQFESLLHPFTLALSIPLMMFGVSSALLLTGHSLNISSSIGMIMLVGIVVNSVIVLYEFISQNRKAELNGEFLPSSGIKTGIQDPAHSRLAEILIYSGRERLRPILLTTLTTLLGLMPMALGLGEGGDLQAPMAAVVIGGLSVSSVLSLIAFPTFYYVFESRLKTDKKNPRPETNEGYGK